MNIDIDAIEEAARNATAPPWREAPGGIYGAVVADDVRNEMLDENRDAYSGYLIGESMQSRDRRYLVAVQPDVVLELCRRARAAGFLAAAAAVEEDPAYD